jgi:hypothetical protein
MDEQPTMIKVSVFLFMFILPSRKLTSALNSGNTCEILDSVGGENIDEWLLGYNVVCTCG